MIDWIHHSAGDGVLLPNLQADTRPDPNARDLTGYVWTKRP
jgi:hypothetical protein